MPKQKLRRSDWRLEPQYLDPTRLGSVRSPSYSALFHEGAAELDLVATLDLGGERLPVGFRVRQARGTLYEASPSVPPGKEATLNEVCRHWPNPFRTYFASPVATVRPIEPFQTAPNVARLVHQRRSGEVLRNRLADLGARDELGRFSDDVSSILTGCPVGSASTPARRGRRTRTTVVLDADVLIPEWVRARSHGGGAAVGGPPGVAGRAGARGRPARGGRAWVGARDDGHPDAIMAACSHVLSETAERVHERWSAASAEEWVGRIAQRRASLEAAGLGKVVPSEARAFDQPKRWALARLEVGGDVVRGRRREGEVTSTPGRAAVGEAPPARHSPATGR